MPRSTVVVGAITLAALVVIVGVTVLRHGIPEGTPILPGIAGLLILLFGTRAAIRRYGGR